MVPGCVGAGVVVVVGGVVVVNPGGGANVGGVAGVVVPVVVVVLGSGVVGGVVVVAVVVTSDSLLRRGLAPSSCTLNNVLSPYSNPLLPAILLTGTMRDTGKPVASLSSCKYV